MVKHRRLCGALDVSSSTSLFGLLHAYYTKYQLYLLQSAFHSQLYLGSNTGNCLAHSLGTVPASLPVEGTGTTWGLTVTGIFQAELLYSWQYPGFTCVRGRSLLGCFSPGTYVSVINQYMAII